MLPLLTAAIITSSVSSASSGGVVVQGSASSQDSSYSSVSVETVVNDGVGTSTVQIQNNQGGEVHTQTITQPIVPGHITVIATSSGSAHAAVYVGASARPPSTTMAATSTLRVPFFASFSSWFAHILHFFW